MPAIVRYQITPAQWKVLDWVAFNEGKVAIFPLELSRTSLRLLNKRGLVEAVAARPAVYRLTAVGRISRVIRASQGSVLEIPVPIRQIAASVCQAVREASARSHTVWGQGPGSVSDIFQLDAPKVQSTATR